MIRWSKSLTTELPPPGFLTFHYFFREKCERNLRDPDYCLPKKRRVAAHCVRSFEGLHSSVCSLRKSMTPSLLPIETIAHKLNLPEKYFEPIGRHGAKLRLELLNDPAFPPRGKLVLVTATTPTARPPRCLRSAISIAMAGQVRLSRGRREARLRITGSFACWRESPISLARLRLWGMEADWAVFQGMGPCGSSKVFGDRAEVMM